MKTNLFKICTAAAAALVLAGTASAHRAWMLPSTFTLSGDEQWVTVDAAASNNVFVANHNALRLDDLSVTAPDGSAVEVQNEFKGRYRSVFDVKLDKQGTYRISTGGAGYSASWKEGEETKRWRGSLDELKAQGIAAKPGAEITRSIRRNETFVTLGSPTEAVFATEGTGLELKPVTHPNDVFAGEEVKFQFLLEGKPAAGVAVQLIRGGDRYRDSEDALTLTSDATGTVSFVLDIPGAYWLEAEKESEGTLDGKAITERTAYVASFEALPN